MSETETEEPTPDNGPEPNRDHATLPEAFVAAQAEFPAVEKDGTNPHFKSRFVTLGNLIAKVRPVLNRHGLSVIQLPCLSEDGKPMLRTILLHTSGEKIESDAPLMLTKQDPQGQGSAITYMRRYAIASALGISDQEDDDGNAGSAPEPAAAPPKAIDDDLAKSLGAAIIDDLELPADRIRRLFLAIGGAPPETPDDLPDAMLALTQSQGEQMQIYLEREARKREEGK